MPTRSARVRTTRLADLTPELRGEPPPRVLDAPAEVSTVASRERVRLAEALQRAGGNKGEAARALGLHRATLWRKLREHGLA
jgi:two-component system response regulator AtoC